MMSYEPRSGRGPLNYAPCRYPGSKLRFRGPARCVEGDYVAMLGGTETFGKFIPVPFPELVERRLGLACVNLGWPNAGLDVLLHDDGLVRIARDARAVVLQLPGAVNLTNRFYRVHPRRNDRFLHATRALRGLFPEVDFTEFHFTRHMLRNLGAVSPERFDLVREELRTAWVERMIDWLRLQRAPVVLLWFSGRRPGRSAGGVALPHDPALVTRAMLNTVAPHAAHLVEVTVSKTARRTGTSGMVFARADSGAAAGLPGPAAHTEVQLALTPVLRALLEPDRVALAR